MKKLIAVLGFVAAIQGYSGHSAAQTELSPEAKAKKASEDAQWAREVTAVSRLRKGIKNPASFNLEQALRMEDGTLCLSYRATNSFNAVVPARAVITDKAITTSDNEARLVPLWNKLCGGRKGTDISYIRRALH
jgi:hypothetical protein